VVSLSNHLGFGTCHLGFIWDLVLGNWDFFIISSSEIWILNLIGQSSSRVILGMDSFELLLGDVCIDLGG
jgi:hypothetical protein